MLISDNGVAVLHYFESCKLTAYPDPGSKDGNPWTIGWGHTGPEVVRGLVWTQAQADAALVADLAKFEARVTRLVSVAISQGQFDALVSFDYNTGSLNTSTLLKLLNAGDYTGAAAQFARWNKNDGQVMRGLTRRRAAEVALWDGLAGAAAISAGVKAA
ncbi:MAG: Lysozyme RrrD [Pseudomonas sp.]|nr:MAG: Lysozyme RrrD [Pseudomonas sp.]